MSNKLRRVQKTPSSKFKKSAGKAKKKRSTLFSSLKISARINGLVIMAIIAMSSISGLAYYKETQNTYFLTQQENFRSLGQQALNIEKDFLKFSLQKQEFFANKDNEFAAIVNGSLGKLIKSLSALSTTCSI